MQREALIAARSSAEPARSAGGVLAKPTRSAGGTSWFALAPRWHQRGALRALCTPFLYMVLVGFERRLPIGDLQLTRSGFFAAKSWPPL